MGIYNTYKEAVLANGSTNGVYTDGERFLTNGSEGAYYDTGPCNPAAFLETLESFLASGKRLVSGDLITYLNGAVKSVENPKIMNTLADSQNQRYVLQAAADQVETPEEKEAFDAIDTTPQQVESLGKPEWKNGDSVVFGKDDRSGVYIAYDAYNEGHVIYSGGDYFYVLSGDFSKPDTPAEREERERLEAAYYLYCKCGIQHETVSFEKFKDGDDCYPGVWLGIVDETGYRKD